MKTDIKFETLGLSKIVLDAILEKNFKTASEIQAKVIPLILAYEHDVIGIAQTGTGKTGAFGLPIINDIKEGNKFPKAMIITPTRELALQITSEMNTFKGKKNIKIVTVYGGQSISSQMSDLNRGCDVVVGTPGRVLDLIKRRKLNLSEISHFVFDEADEMLKMGFIEDIEEILDATPSNKRVYLFSATMPDRIKSLSKKYMAKQVVIEVKKQQFANADIIHSYHVLKNSEKLDALKQVVDSNDFFYGIVFCNTKANVDSITLNLKKEGYAVDCIHGDIAQAKREKILDRFRKMKITILVATDVAARGIDVNDLTHVINYNVPRELDTYTHRIGRTGRAGKKGIAISFISSSEIRQLKSLEKTHGFRIDKGIMPKSADNDLKKEEKMLLDIDTLINSGSLEKHVELSKKLNEKYGSLELVSALLHKINSTKKPTFEDIDFEDKPRRYNKEGSRSNFKKKSYDRPKRFDDKPRRFDDDGSKSDFKKKSYDRPKRFDDKPRSFNKEGSSKFGSEKKSYDKKKVYRKRV